MGLHERIMVNGICIDFREKISEEDYVETVIYLFFDSNQKPRSSFFYREISEVAYKKIFHALKGNPIMFDFLKELFLINREYFSEAYQKELNEFFN